jgi:hypothetical protein
MYKVKFIFIVCLLKKKAKFDATNFRRYEEGHFFGIRTIPFLRSVKNCRILLFVYSKNSYTIESVSVSGLLHDNS